MAFSFFFGFVFFFGVELRVGKLEGGRLVVRGQDRRKGEVVVVLVFELELMSVTTRIPEAVHTPGTCSPSQFYILATPPSSIDRNFANSRAFDINQVVGFVCKY